MRRSRLTRVNPSETIPSTSKFRSKFEAVVAASLTKRGMEYSYESKELPYQLQNIYTPDFFLANGVVVEVKGLFSPEDRRKMVAVKSQHPKVDLRICFMDARKKLSKAPGSITYGQWATRHGFVWSSGRIPTEWLTNEQVHPT